VKDGQVTRGWIGVEPQDLTPELAQSFGVGVDSGVIITGVLQNGPAAQAGIRPGDVITRVKGRDVKDVPQLLAAVAALPPGEKAELDVLRRADRGDAGPAQSRASGHEPALIGATRRATPPKPLRKRLSFRPLPRLRCRPRSS